MRLLIVSVLIMVLAGCRQSVPGFNLSTNDPKLSTSQRGELFYDGEPFSGYLLEHYEDGQLKSKTGYLNGLLESQSLGYYPNGELMYERPYLDGEKHGIHLGYYEDGSKRYRYHFENGLSVGNHKMWYPDGQLAKEMNYKEGRPFGPQKVWRSDGKIRSNFVVREDGRRYGLVGMKRCKNIDTEAEIIEPLTAEVYDK